MTPQFREKQFDIGDRVYPKTKAGLWLSVQPTDGDQKQALDKSNVLLGRGRVLAIHDVIIDYDTWEPEYYHVGKIRYRSCLVEHADGVGWAGSSALVSKRSEQLG